MSEMGGGSDDSTDRGGGSEVSSGGGETGTTGSAGESGSAGALETGGSSIEAGEGFPEPGGSARETETGLPETGGKAGSLELGGGSPSFEAVDGGKEEVGTPESLEGYHRQSVDQILESNGKYMTETDRERVANGADRLEFMPYNPYGRQTGSYRFSQGESRIQVASISEIQQERSVKHETNHFASKHREIIVPEPDRHGYTVYQTVGMRQSSWFHSVRTGENSGYSEQGRGINEGLTTLFTNQQLAELSKEKGEAAEREKIYPQAVELCSQLETMVGEDSLKEAYYGGNTKQLEGKVEALAGDKEYGRLRECLDRTISRDYGERMAAVREAQEILARMSERSQKK